ncbi:LysM peptidoglycan-binding domain-containing protein [Desemzia sp. RIT804]|uniref:LysM peptidoglycan-binding domain-containing protein n=1 Tax=Desemzia sp. RIT 804 TaxID=2810209 RepID=UPI0019525069|nr:LysM peptidoglycan-binding domain-containing protein [Desemzia sp. RIT 804]MBM6613719.1 LysM peptidoglycan-binding domain-containing protein [Desemzia sp. RIT 804]
MARKKKGHSNDTDELWSRTFDENEGYTNGNYSRIERKRADKAISPVLKSLWIFLALFIILPTSVYLWYTYNDQNTSEPETEKLVVKENESSESESSEAEESEDESTVSESEESEEADESKVAQAESESKIQAESVSSEPESVESSKVVESESQPVQESSVSEESTQVVESQTTNTYTVKAGDNLYRIALNHGMSTDQLKSLNGLTTDEVSVGTILVVN